MNKKEAIRKAKRLRDMMITSGWKIRVWENLGWHYEINNETVSVTESSGGRYFAMLRPHYSYWEVPHHKNPNKAVELLLKEALEVSLRHLSIVLKGKSLI